LSIFLANLQKENNASGHNIRIFKKDTLHEKNYEVAYAISRKIDFSFEYTFQNSLLDIKIFSISNNAETR
jgi:hypothetical protein